MPSLLLVRHEDAHLANDEGDALRSLTPAGRVRMHLQARALAEALPGLDRVLTSPLVRAVQTAEILVAAFDLEAPVQAVRALVEPPSLESLAALLRSQPAGERVVAVVGHEPTLSALINHLVGAEAILGVRTGQAVLLDPAGSAYRLAGSWRGGVSTSAG